MKRMSVLMVLFVLPVTMLAFPVRTQAQADERCFEETGYCISGNIRTYWEQNGGLPVFGYPITPVEEQTIEGVWTGPVQWFERDRLEDHSADGEGVLAGRLGALALELAGTPWTSFPQVESAPQGCRFFAETGHSVCPPFAAYWEQNGGLERFGYPITEAMEMTIDGWTGNVQYFERRRMEHHTENVGTEFEVLLGLLGKAVLEAGQATARSGRIAFTSTQSGDQDVWVMDADGSNARNVTNNPGRSDFQPVWSPDGSQIAYVSGTEVTQDQDIWIINTDGSDARQLTDNPTADWGPAWSPDGSQVAFVSDRNGNADIFVRNADGSGEDTLLTTFGPETAEYAPAWSPDGTRIAYASNEGGTPNIWVMRSDGTEQYNLTNNNYSDANNPAWSPDSSRIAFDIGLSSFQDITIVNTDGTEMRDVAYGRVNNPTWSPDGRWLAFESEGDIVVATLDNTERYNLTNSTEYVDRDAVWGP